MVSPGVMAQMVRPRFGPVGEGASRMPGGGSRLDIVVPERNCHDFFGRFESLPGRIAFRKTDDREGSQ